MEYSPEFRQVEQAFALLAEAGVAVPDGAREQLAAHVALIKQWQRAVSLVSAGDIGTLWTRHVVDSLSLAPCVPAGEGTLLDIGSGGGFPAIPLMAVLPELRVVMLERSERKAGFLRKAVAALGLQGAEVLCGAFPNAAGSGERVSVVTARAVERPERVIPAILEWLPVGAWFLGQWPELEAHVRLGMFHVERIEDLWSQQGLRRGRLWRVKRLPS